LVFHPCQVAERRQNEALVPSHFLSCNPRQLNRTVTIPQAYELAFQHHQSGRLAEAEALYRQILAVEPRHADALHLLGVVAHQVGRNELAVDWIRQAIALAPNVPAFYSNLGEAHRALGQLDEAIAACRQAIVLRPDYPEAHNNLGIVLKEKGQFDEAITACRQAIVLRPDYPEAHSNLGIALEGRGQLDEAIASYRQAIALSPGFPGAHFNLGNALKGEGQLDEAIAAYRQAIALRSDYPEAHSNLGIALKEKGQLDEAIASCRQAIALRPNYAEAHGNLGNALKDKGQMDEAIAAYRRAIVLKPDYPEADYNLGVALYDKGQLDEAIIAYRQAIALNPSFPEAHYNLGNALRDKGQLDEAIAAYHRTIAFNPSFPEAHGNLGSTLKDKGQLDEAIAAYRQAIVLKPRFAEAHSNLLFTLNYHPSLDPRSIAQEHRRWGQQHAEALRQFIRPHSNDRTADRKLRVGYVSPDFREHPVALFAENLFANHDRAQVEVFCYSNVPRPDAITARMEQHAGKWREIRGMTDARVAELIREDGVDILVDLAGHTAKNRLLVFARKPAPVQVSWLGYPNTTGLDTVDFRMSDAIADPPGSTEALHSEQLVRLPDCAWCFRPAEDAPGVDAPPVAQTGSITFGCFNAMPKINGPLLELWSQILLAVPGSRLLLKNAAMREPSVQRRMRAVLEKAGIRPERVELMGPVSAMAGHLGTYSRMDIALDTFPYHGTTTTCEALWMGVPVITLAGKTHVSRVGVSLLGNVGLQELVAGSPGEYARLAVELADDIPRLTHLRSALRERMEASPLMDAPRFARNVEAAYRIMWRKWCAENTPP